MTPTSLTDLPTCVNLTLLTYLDATSKFQLSRTCQYFENLVKHPWLWKHIDARRCPNDNKRAKFMVDKIYKSTQTFLLRGFNRNDEILPPNFFNNIAQFDYITIMALEQQLIGQNVITVNGASSIVTMKDFPKSLKELSLKQTQVFAPQEFFRQSHETKPNLKVLILDKCDWVTTATFMSLSKYENLEILSLYNCVDVGNSIPYLSLAWQFGFKKLKIIDARLTRLGNTLIRSLYRSQSILAVYLQNGDISYQIDISKRCLALLKGVTTPHVYEDDLRLMELITLQPEEYVRLGDPKRYLDDYGLIDLSSVYSKKTDVKFPKSYLYLDPYNPCTCGYEENLHGKKSDSGPKRNWSDFSDSSDSDDDNDDDLSGSKLAAVVSVKTRLSRLKRHLRHSQRHPRESQNRPIPLSLVLNEGELPPVGTQILMPLTHLDAISVDLPQAQSSNHSNHEEIENSLGNKREASSIRDNNEAGCSRDSDRINQRFPPKKRRLEPEKSSGKKQKLDDEEAGPSGLNNKIVAPIPTPPPVENPPGFNEQIRRVDIDDDDVPIRFINIGRFINLGQNVKESVPLKRLSFRGFDEITDAVMIYVANLDLEILDLCYTNISIAAINNYLVNHPYCRIIHPKFCRCPINLDF